MAIICQMEELENQLKNWLLNVLKNKNLRLGNRAEVCFYEIFFPHWGQVISCV